MNNMKCFLALFFVALTAASLPEEDGGLYEGDMELTEAQKKYLTEGSFKFAATINRQWPTTIPYSYSVEIATQDKAVKAIQNAIKEYHEKTCLRFVPHSNESSYIHFVKKGGCFSGVGKCYGRCEIFLASGCWWTGTVVHEIGHRIGFYHEQSRPDRDQFIKINWGNIAKGKEHNFRKQPYSNIDSLNTRYDFRSVMHYSRGAFGGGKVTIDAIDPANNNLIGNRRGLSDIDALQVNSLYKCPGYTKPPPVATGKPTPVTRYPSTAPPIIPTTRGKLVIRVRSEGFHDKNKTPGFGGGKATILVNGVDYSKSKRGFNVVVVSSDSGVVTASHSYDTYASYRAAKMMDSFIKNLKNGSIVLVAVQDEASIQSRYVEAALMSLGSTKHSLTYRQSYALIGFKGPNKPLWVTEERLAAGYGPSIVTATIPKPASIASIEIVSEGCKARGINRTVNQCGTASLKFNGKELSLSRRGYNFACFDYKTGRLLSSAAFDTYGSRAQASQIPIYISQLPQDTVVMVAIQDEGSIYSDLVKAALRSIGAKYPAIAYRSSYALLGYKGTQQVSWVTEVNPLPNMGPVRITRKITLGDHSIKPSPVTTSPPIPTTQIPMTTRGPPVPLPADCGRSSASSHPGYVISGQDAIHGAWPWQVGLYKNGGFSCGGSLIHKEWIVTAAHCIRYTDPSKYVVKLGDHRRNYRDGSEVEITAVKVIQHPSYKKPVSLNNDIALIKLSRPVVFTPKIQPVCLPRQSSAPTIGRKCYITGWGKISHPGSSNDVLQQAVLPVRSKSECQLRQRTQGTNLPITDEMLCAGYTRNSTTSGCHGDSGGPYVCQEANGRWTLEGAVSWGSPRCDINEAFTVFARVAKFRKWIEDEMR